VRDVVRRGLMACDGMGNLNGLRECCTYGSRKVQAFCGHAFTRRLKRDDRQPKCNSEKRSKRAPKGMPDDPNVRIRKHKRDIVVEVLRKK